MLSFAPSNLLIASIKSSNISTAQFAV